MKTKKTNWVRKCPDCGNDIFYSTKYGKKYAENRNTSCRKCKPQGGWLKGMKHSKSSREKMSEVAIQYYKENPRTKEHTEKIAKKHRGKVGYWKGKNRKKTYENEDIRRRMRQSRAKYLQEVKEITFPNYNMTSIPILEKKAKELRITDLQHAENGGEYHIKELGYWVDGYSKEKNIVLEYYEPHHKWGKYPKKDKLRKGEIIDHLGCEFYEIWYDDIQ